MGRAALGRSVPDRWNISYFSFVLLGAGFLLPWNAFITASDYYEYVYPVRGSGSGGSSGGRALGTRGRAELARWLTSPGLSELAGRRNASGRGSGARKRSHVF